MPHTPRRSRRWWVAGLAGGLSALTAAAIIGLGATANAATLFSDNFESGSASSWSKSGGTWAVVTDGSKVLQESSSSSDIAREFNGSNSWTDYSLQAQVKPLAFGSSDGLVGISARTSSSSKFYRLALNSSGQAVLQAYAGSSSITTLGSKAVGTATGTWYTLRIDVTGSTIAGYVNGALVASATNTMASSGRISVQTFHASGEFDNVTVSNSSTSTPTPTTASPTAASPTPSRTSTSPTASASPTPTGTGGTGGTSSTLYVAPTGTDSAAGTLAAPTTLAAAITRIAAGGTICLRGGTYNYSTTVTIATGNNGTSSARKNLSAYPAEKPVLNFSAMAEDPANRGLAVNGNYWHIYGIQVQHAGDNGIFVGGSNNIIERVVTAFNHDSGLQISRTASDTPQSAVAGEQPDPQLGVARQRRLRR